MRKYLSVFALQVKSTFTKILAVIMLMCLSQLGLFIHILNSDETIVTNRFTNEEFLAGIEIILKNSRAISFIFALGFLFVTVILATNGCKYNSREDYTLRRLNITEKKAVICKGIYGISAYILLIIAEALVMLAVCLIYLSFAENHPYSFEGLISNQTVFLAFYRSRLMHAVLPLEDLFKYFSTFIAILGMSFSTAFIPYFIRRKKLFLEAFILIPIVIMNFTSTWTSGYGNDMFLIGVSAIILGVLMVRVSKEEQAYDR